MGVLTACGTKQRCHLGETQSFANNLMLSMFKPNEVQRHKDKKGSLK